MTDGGLDPLRLTFTVDCGADHAFEVWTARFGSWWPRSHVMSGEADAVVTLEPEVGGRIFERTSGGREFDWGVVTAWDPPSRLAFRWHLMFDPADATDVVIGFSADERGSTTVTIEHSGWERLGAAGPERRTRNEAGWSGVFVEFRAATQVA